MDWTCEFNPCELTAGTRGAAREAAEDERNARPKAENSRSKAKRKLHAGCRLPESAVMCLHFLFGGSARIKVTRRTCIMLPAYSCGREQRICRPADNLPLL